MECTSDKDGLKDVLRQKWHGGAARRHCDWTMADHFWDTKSW